VEVSKLQNTATTDDKEDLGTARGKDVILAHYDKYKFTHRFNSHLPGEPMFS